MKLRVRVDIQEELEEMISEVAETFADDECGGGSMQEERQQHHEQEIKDGFKHWGDYLGEQVIEFDMTSKLARVIPVEEWRGGGLTTGVVPDGLEYRFDRWKNRLAIMAPVRVEMPLRDPEFVILLRDSLYTKGLELTLEEAEALWYAYSQTFGEEWIELTPPGLPEEPLHEDDEDVNHRRVTRANWFYGQVKPFLETRKW